MKQNERVRRQFQIAAECLYKKGGTVSTKYIGPIPTLRVSKWYKKEPK